MKGSSEVRPVKEEQGFGHVERECKLLVGIRRELVQDLTYSLAMSCASPFSSTLGSRATRILDLGTWMATRGARFGIEARKGCRARIAP